MGLKLVDVTKSPAAGKKWRATFSDGTTTDFGATGYSDYTKHKDKDRRDNYIARHKSDLETDDPTRAGYLSMFILWNKPSLQASIEDYKRRLKSGNWKPPGQ